MISCSATPDIASQPLVAVWTPDRRRIAIDSLHDLTHPRTLCTISGAYNVRFISNTEIGYVTNSSSNDPIHGTSRIVRENLIGHEVTVLSVQGEVMDAAWSPDGSSVAYLLYTDVPNLGSGAANQLWLKIGSAPPRALTPLIPLYGRGGSIDDQTIVRFSHDGKYLLMVDTFVGGVAPASGDQATVQVHTADGSLVFVPPSAQEASRNGFTTMAVWSRQSDRLYYRDPAGVHTWDPPSTQGTMVAGLGWFWPSISLDDRFVAYVVRGVGNALESPPHVEVRDLGSNTVTVIPVVRGAPWFISNNLLLEAEYAPNPQQGPGPLYGPTGKGFTFDVYTKVETPLPAVIDPIDSWPHSQPGV